MSIREIAEEIAEGVTNQEYHNRKLADRIEKALRDERERALGDAACQECVFCAGVEGYNPSPVQAALPVEMDAGNYVHRNDPPHGLAGVYCTAQRIRALITAIRNGEVSHDSKTTIRQ